MCYNYDRRRDDNVFNYYNDNKFDSSYYFDNLIYDRDSNTDDNIGDDDRNVQTNNDDGRDH